MTERYNRPRRRGREGSTALQALGVTTAGLFAALVVVIASKGGHSARKYDAETEARLQHAIRPTMTKLARKAIDFESARPNDGIRINYNAAPSQPNREHSYGIDIDTIRNGIQRQMRVVMGLNPKTDDPDPGMVRSVEFGKSVGDSSSEVGGTAFLAAPGGEADLRIWAHASDTHTEGWTAAQAFDGQARIFDSSNPRLFIAPGREGKDSNPVSTASAVVSDVQQEFNEGLSP